MRALIIVLAAWFGIVTSASAWSETGHRVIGQLAYEHLTPKAKTAVDQIISKNSAVGEAANSHSRAVRHAYGDLGCSPNCAPPADEKGVCIEMQ
jgi:hypothetical protein